MRILVYGLNTSPELIGVGKYTGEMIAWLTAAGHDVRVVAAFPYYPDWKVTYDRSCWIWRREARDGARVLRCPVYVPAKPGGLKRLLHLFSFAVTSFPAVIWQALIFRPDIVFMAAPTLICMPGAVFAKWIGGAKAWLHIQDFEVDAAFDLGILKGNLLKSLALRLERWAYAGFDRISSISDNMCNRLIEKGIAKSKLSFYPNWVDTEAIRPIDDDVSFRRELDIGDGRIVVLYSGNMNEKQGIHIIVDAARILSHNSAIQFVLAGGGPARSGLETQAKELTNIRFLPLQPFEKLNGLLNLADIHLLPQLADAADLVMPSKLTGMLASGRPVIACASPGTQIAKLVDNCGEVVAPEDAAALAEAIKNLAADEHKRQQLGAAARRLAIENWEKEGVLSRFAQELRRLID